MRVLHFIDTDAFAGTERHILDLAAGLEAQGADTAILCPESAPLAGRATSLALEVIGVENHGLWDWEAVQTLRRLLGGDEDVILHVHNGRTALLAAVAASLAGRGRVVMTQHFLFPAHVAHQGVKAVLFRTVHRWVNRRIHRFIAISGAVRHEMLVRGDAPPARIDVVHNGLSCCAPAAPLNAVREEFGIPDEAPLIVCVARLEPEKDVKTLLAAMALLLQTHPQARALVVGDGSQRGTLEAERQVDGVAHAVHLTGFRVDAPTLVAAADVFVLPSLAEPFGLVLLEAMAMGKAVVATDAGGPREIVVEGETGRLVSPGQPAALAAALSHLITCPETARSMGENGRRRYERLYTVDRMTADTLRVYESAMGAAACGKAALGEA